MSVYVKKVWGYEEIIVNNDLYCAKFLVIRRGYQTSLHYHEEKDETFYIMSGVVDVRFAGIEDSNIYLLPGDTTRIKPGRAHQIRATEEDIRILEVSTHHEDSDSKRIEDGGRIEE